MGKGKYRHSNPFYKPEQPKKIEGVKSVPMPISRALQPGQTLGPVQVEARPVDTISDKTLSFVVDALDCCAEKVIKEYVPYFQMDGYQVTVTQQKAAEEVIKLCPQWVVLLRLGTGKTFPFELGVPNAVRVIQHLRRLGIRVIYYIDDFMVSMNNGAPVAIAGQCDAVIVATTELKEFFENVTNFKAPVIHVPTHVDIPTFDIVPALDYVRNIQRFKVLFTSSGRVGATGLFEICEKANEIPEFDDIQFIVNSAGVAQMRTLINSFRHLHKTYIDSIPLHQYYGLCKSVNLIVNPGHERDLDYLVPPQFQSQWLHSKSALKYTMAGAARIPCISSPMRSYLEAIREGETGFIVNNADEFIEKILYFYNNPTATARMGIAARQDIMANFDIRKRYKQYLAAITGEVPTESKTVTVDSLPTTKTTKAVRRVYVPSIDGGPGSFYANMRKYLPIVSQGKWSVTNDITFSDAAIAIAFLDAGKMFEQMKRGMKYIYRLDGLPTNFDGTIHENHMKLMKELFLYASKIVWQSQHCKDMWNSRGFVPENIDAEGVIIHNGVDTATFTPKPPFATMAAKEKTNILHVNWSTFPHKRIDFLEEIVKYAMTNLPNVHFSMLGNYKNMVVADNAAVWEPYSNVGYLGQVTDRNRASIEKLVEIYKSADLLLFTSEMEGSPNTVLEATACGMPIMYNSASNVVPEICGTECIGFGTVEEFAANLPKYKDIKPTLKEEFTMQNCVKKYLEALEEICS